MAIAVEMAKVPDDAVRIEGVALVVFPRNDSVFPVWAFSDEASPSALDAALGSEDGGADSVTLAPAAPVIVAPGLRELS